ncbi:MAG TPA: NADH-quinone oxidoreductase subunit H [Gemmatimonadales bacterium]
MTGTSLAALGIALLAAPALPGIAGRTKAMLTGRTGSPVWQLYRDLAKLMRKGAVYSTVSTWVFRLAPAVLLACVLVASLFVPLDGRTAIVRFDGDLVAFAYLLALGRFGLVLAALDTGSSFEGMGASRDVTYASFVEPALFLSFTGLALASDSLSLSGFLGEPLAAAWSRAAPSLVMIAGSLFVVLLAETSRVPFDDPATHLELTMIHEVAVLDHSGPDLAIILYAGALKLTLLAAVVIGVLIPRAGWSGAVSIAVLVGGLAMVGVAVGVIESVMARLRLTRVPQVLVAASALAAFGIILLLG